MNIFLRFDYIQNIHNHSPKFSLGMSSHPVFYLRKLNWLFLNSFSYYIWWHNITAYIIFERLGKSVPIRSITFRGPIAIKYIPDSGTDITRDTIGSWPVPSPMSANLIRFTTATALITAIKVSLFITISFLLSSVFTSAIPINTLDSKLKKNSKFKNFYFT